MAETDGTVVVAPIINGNGARQRRDFQIIVSIALGVCLAIQAAVAVSLMRFNPPDASWQLVSDLMKHLSTLDVGLMGGLLGMARPS